jgi:tetratricopeptide (TPR) repeat protein
MNRAMAVILVAAALSFLALPAVADDGGAETIFHLGAGARAMGMGNGYVGLAGDATAVYYNPAGIARLGTQQVTFLHTFLFEGTIYDYVAYVYPLGDPGSLGIGVMRIGTDDIGRRDLTRDMGTFDASHTQVMLSYGRRFDGRLYAGATLKLVNQSIDNLSAYGYGLDMGGQIQIWENLQAGLRLQDVIGARLKLAQAKERTPYSITAGMAYFRGLPWYGLNGVATLDFDKPENRSLKVRTGLEITHPNGLSVRCGYDRDNVALGLGFRYQRLQFDYAYKFVNDLTDSHRFSLTYDFGLSQQEKTARQADIDLRQRQQTLAESRRRSLMEELTRADRYYAAGELDSSLAAYYRADAFAEDKTLIHARIEELRKKLVAKGQRPPSGAVADSALAQGLENQGRELFEKGALAAARDIVAIARRYEVRSPGLDSLEQAIRLGMDKEVWVSLNKAENALASGDYITAYEHYSLVLVYDPANKKAADGVQRAENGLNLAQKVSLGLIYFNQGNYASAKREFDAVLRLDGGNQTAQEYLVRIESKLKASTSLEDLQKDSRIWKLYLDGLEAFRQGDYQKAIKSWQSVLDVYPNNQNALGNIEQARLRLKR